MCLDPLGIARQMGFNCSSYSETIVVVGDKREYYVAPLGLKLCGRNLVARIYRDTGLHRFLKTRLGKEKIGVSVCVTNDPVLFYKTVLHRDQVEVEVVRETDSFTPVVKGCSGYVTGYVDRFYEKSLFLELYIEVDKAWYTKVIPKTIVRAEYAVIEALVYLTKIPYYDSSYQEELYRRITWCQDIVYRSTENIVLRKIINEIVGRAEQVVKK